VPTRSDCARRNSAGALATARLQAATRLRRRVRTAAFARGSTAWRRSARRGTGRQGAAARHQCRAMRRWRCLRAAQAQPGASARCGGSEVPGFERAQPSNVALPLPNDRLFVEGKYTNRFLLECRWGQSGRWRRRCVHVCARRPPISLPDLAPAGTRRRRVRPLRALMCAGCKHACGRPAARPCSRSTHTSAWRCTWARNRRP